MYADNKEHTYHMIDFYSEQACVNTCAYARAILHDNACAGMAHEWVWRPRSMSASMRRVCLPLTHRPAGSLKTPPCRGNVRTSAALVAVAKQKKLPAAEAWTLVNGTHAMLSQDLAVTLFMWVCACTLVLFPVYYTP